jgi:hypothetical protein
MPIPADAEWDLGDDNLGKNTLKVLQEAGITPAMADGMTATELESVEGLGLARRGRVTAVLAGMRAKAAEAVPTLPDVMLGELAPSLKHAERYVTDYDPQCPADHELIETPDLAQLAAAVGDPDAEQVLYRVTYGRVGRRGGRNGSPPPPALTVWALTADALAQAIRTDIRPYLASKDVEVYVDLETGRGSIQAGWNNGGDFTIERVAATEGAKAATS